MRYTEITGSFLHITRERLKSDRHGILRRAQFVLHLRLDPFIRLKAVVLTAVVSRTKGTSLSTVIYGRVFKSTGACKYLHDRGKYLWTAPGKRMIELII